MQDILFQISIWLVPALLAITLHEAAHGYVAKICGDNTADKMGRVSLNPMRHIDPLGTVILPGLLLLAKAPFLFGYAKPVPVAFHKLNHPKRDMILVALAGPAMNIFLALCSLYALYSLSNMPSSDFMVWIYYNCANSVHLNVVLAVFNMLPILPLDGGRVVVGLLPYPYDQKWAQTEKYGFFLVILIVSLIPGLISIPTGYVLSFLKNLI